MRILECKNHIQLCSGFILLAIFGFVVSPRDKEASLQRDVVSQKVVYSRTMSSIIGASSMKVRVYKDSRKSEVLEGLIEILEMKISPLSAIAKSHAELISAIPIVTTIDRKS